MIIETLVFFILVQISYFSILGFGRFYCKREISISDIDLLINFSIGIIILNLLGILFYYTNINSPYINLFVILFGLVLFFRNYEWHKYYKVIYLNIFFFSGLLISKLHEDWPYHFSFIEQITLQKPIIGIGNVDDIHILSASLFSYLQKIFFLPYFEFKLILIPTYLLYFSILIFLVNFILKKKNNLFLIFFIFLTLLVVKLSRLSEFGYDYLSNFILLKILILYLINQSNLNKNLPYTNIYILLFLYALTIKITALFFLPILIYFIISDTSHRKKIFVRNKFNILSLFILSFLIIENFLRSGCLLYFLQSTCFSNTFITWSMDYDRVLNHSQHIELWAKGFFIQNIIEDPAVYLNIKNWLNVWVNNHFFYKIFEFIIIPILFLIYIIFNGKFVIKNKKYISFLLVTIISISCWMYFLPQLRFGTTIILSFFISLSLIFYEHNSEYFFNQKRKLYAVILIIIIFNLQNLIRINDEFKRDDEHKFLNFPFPPEKRIIRYESVNNSIKFLLDKNKSIKSFKWFYIIN